MNKGTDLASAFLTHKNKDATLDCICNNHLYPNTMATKKTKRPFLKKNHYEQIAWQKNSIVCGVDEVGRGCLAGPLVVAAVILPPHTNHRLLKDSKEMTEQEREKAAQWILKHCRYGYGIVHHRLIDKHNIWHATLIGMRRALINLLATYPEKPDSIIVDAMPLKLDNTAYADIPVYHFPFGEKKSSSIAAASILAKVKRDRMMLDMNRNFPHFGWATNKGYCTTEHTCAISVHSSVVVHRKTFLKNLMRSAQEQKERSMQQGLFSHTEQLI